MFLRSFHACYSPALLVLQRGLVPYPSLLNSAARVRGENIQPTGPWRAPRPSSPPAGRAVDT
eukprot:3989198-Pyramimonas_sp.AAC.1